MSLTKEQILGASDLEPVSVEVPEWGGVALLRPLSGREADAVYSGNPDGPTTVRRIVALSLVGDDGARLFTAADADALYDRSMAAVSRLTEVALRINRLNKDADADAKKG